MNTLNIQNLILFHTEDTHENQKELYTKEAKKLGIFNNIDLINFSMI